MLSSLGCSNNLVVHSRTRTYAKHTIVRWKMSQLTANIIMSIYIQIYLYKTNKDAFELY
jgi:hypothetical protein